MKTYTTQDIQKKLLEILVYFSDFCQEHQLSFVLAGGTCLGAVRHSGFIPWDDDVDVFMRREDYEKLMVLWPQFADTLRYSCVRSNETLNIRHSATEIKDNHTTFINRHSQDIDMHHGLMIDVIPLDNVAETGWGRIRQYINSVIYCCFNFQRLPEHKGKLTYYATKVALSLIRSPKWRYKIWKKAEANIVKLGRTGQECVASFGEGATIMRQAFPSEWVMNPVYLEFEGYQFPVLRDYTSWLTMSYGDYMELPPKSEQVMRHNAVFIDLENSYEQYKGIYYCMENTK